MAIARCSPQRERRIVREMKVDCRRCKRPHFNDQGWRSARRHWPRSIHLEAFGACHQCQSNNCYTREERWQQEDIGKAQECDPETARDAS